MIKRCSKCKKTICFSSQAYNIDDKLFCCKCANEISKAKALEKTLGWYSQEDFYYSGLIVENDVKTYLALKPIATREEIENNLIKINNLHPEIKNKILEVPQIKIFFENDIPYYVTKNNSTKIMLPFRNENGTRYYYDPVEDTEAYKMVIDDVTSMAEDKFKEHMKKHFDSDEYILGACHIHWAIEAMVLYEKYGIYCINNPMSLNRHLFID